MPRPRALTDTELAEAARRYRAGATMATLAVDFDCGRSTLARHLARHLADAGVPVRRRGRVPAFAQGIYAAADLLRGELAGCTNVEAADALMRRAEAAIDADRTARTGRAVPAADSIIEGDDEL